MLFYNFKFLQLFFLHRINMSRKTLSVVECIDNKISQHNVNLLSHFSWPGCICYLFTYNLN